MRIRSANEFLGQRIKELRVKNHMRQLDVAEQLHMTHAAIGNYETGKREPRIDDLILLADFFEVSIDYLVGRVEEEN